MYAIIKLGNKYGWYMHDDSGNTTKEGKELFETEDECQAFIDKLGGKSESTVEVLSNPFFHVIKLGNKFGWYEDDEKGNTIREGAEVFARHSEAQAFLNETFPAAGEVEKDADAGEKPAAQTTNGPGPEAGATTTDAGSKELTPEAAEALKAFVGDKEMEYPYAFTEEEVNSNETLFANGFRAGDEVASEEELVKAITVHTP